MIKSIGEFEVKSELGRGGMGRVFRAHDPRVDRDVAIKVLTTEGDTDLLGRFRSEAGTTAKLRHQNIVTVYAYGEQDGMPYLVMELLEGRDLRRVIQERHQLTLLDKVRIMHQVAEGLSYAHQNNVIHRDIKPANIMLLRDGCIKIMDFGIARVTGHDSTRRTQKGSLVGTISYMAPEQFKLGMDADHMVDIFAYGDVFYELITGEHPFQADDPGTVIYRITSVEPKPIRELAPECPESLEYIIHQLLTKDRDLRYQSLRDVAFDIEPVLFQLRHEKAEQILLEAQPLIAEGKVDAALVKVKEALEVNPVSREAQRLRNELQRALHNETVRSKVTALLADAEELIAQRKFAEALPVLENVLRLDKGEAVQARLDTVRSNHERCLRAGQLLAEARREAQKGNLTSAHQMASQALDTDPDNTEAGRLANRLHQDLEQKARERALREALQSAVVRADAGNFEEALQILDQAVREHGETPELDDARTRVLSLKADFERKQRHKRFQENISEVRALLGSGTLTEARTAIERMLSDFADWPGLHEAVTPLRDDLNHREQEVEIAAIVKRAGELTRQEKFSQARAELDSALAQYPGHPELRVALDQMLRAKAARERAEDIARATENIARLRQEDLAQALRAADAARRQYPEHKRFAELESELGVEFRERKRRALVEESLQKANDLLGPDPFQAVEILRRTLANVGPEPQIESLLPRAEKAAADRSEQQAVDAILSKAQTFRSAQQWSKALQELERGISRYPRRSELLAAAEESRAELQRITRAEKLLSLTQAIEATLANRDFAKGFGLIEVARRDFPGDRRVEQLAEELTRAKQAQELAELAAGVRQCLSRDDLEGAQRQLAARAGSFGSETEWQSLNEQLDQRRHYLQALQEARALEHQARFPEAEQLLRSASQNPARDKRAEDLLRTVSKKRSRAETELRERQRKEAEARELARKEQERKEAQARELARKEQERKDAEARELARKEQERKDAEARELARKEQERKDAEAGELARKDQERKDAEARELARKEQERKDAEARERARKEQERKDAEARELARKEQERKEAEARELARKEQARKEREALAQAASARQSNIHDAPTVLFKNVAPQPAIQRPEPTAESATVILSGPEVPCVEPAHVIQPEQRPVTPIFSPEPEPGTVPIYRRPVVIAPAAVGAVLLGYLLLRSPSAPEPNSLRPSPAKVSMTYHTGAAQAPSAEVDVGTIAAPLVVSSTVPWLSAQASNRGNRIQLSIRANPSGLSPAPYDGEIRLTSEDKQHALAKATVPVHLNIIAGTEKAAIGPKVTAASTPLRVPSSLQFDYRDGEPLPRAKQIPLPKEQSAAAQTSWENPKDAAWARIDRGQQGFSVSVRPTGMSVGKHTAVLIVSLPGAPNTPQRVPVSLNINSSLGNITFKSQEQIHWRGELKPGEAVTIQGATCSQGSLAAGELPASAIEPDVSGLPHLRIESHPSARNGFKLQLRNTGSEPVTDFTLFYRAVR